MDSGAATLWWLSAASLLLAFIATGIGIVLSVRKAITSNNDGTATVHDGVLERASVAISLGAGLVLTTLAGVFALLTAPPWG